MNYYNEHDPKAAAWLRELIAANLIPAGEVDERDIQKVSPDELRSFTQCHFFAGIGGWPYALRLAGWPEDQPVWTGSCPCQPLSCAGKQRGHADERHLWPAFQSLIAECRPATVFGEQVASADGREWLAGVRADLERMGYAVGAADLCAAGVGAPHIRQRLYWVAYSTKLFSLGSRDHRRSNSEVSSGESQLGDCGDEGVSHGMANSESIRSRALGTNGEHQPHGTGGTGRSSEPSGLANSKSQRIHQRLQAEPEVKSSGTSTVDWLGNANEHGSQGRGLRSGESSSERSPWTTGVEFVQCADGQSRRIKPSIFPLAHGVSGRVGLLRGAGNAIVPQVAAVFIEAFLTR